MRIFLFGALFLLAALGAFAPALAQQVQPEIQLTASASEVSRGPNESLVVTFTVANVGPADGSVTLNAVPVDGWRFDFVDPSTFRLARAGQRLVSLEVFATDLAQNATLQVTGSLTEMTTSRESAPARSEVRLTYLAPPIVPQPPTPPGPSYWPAGAALGGLVLVLVAFQVGSVRLELSSPRMEVTPSGSGYVRVTVKNRWWPARRVHIRVRDIPAPAVAALSLRDVRLKHGESVSVPLMVKAPPEMPDGDQSLWVQARAGWLGPWMSRRRVRLTFRSPVAPDAPLQPLR